MEETPPPLVSSSKPHLEKLTLGITRILGELGRGSGAWEWKERGWRGAGWRGRMDTGPRIRVGIAAMVEEERRGAGCEARPGEGLLRASVRGPEGSPRPPTAPPPWG
jgi:hypothetical protein